MRLERLDNYLKENQYNQVSKSKEINDTRRELRDVLEKSKSEIENNLERIYNATRALNKEYGSILEANNIGSKSFEIGDVYSMEINIAEGRICIRQAGAKIGNSVYGIDTHLERGKFVSHLLDMSNHELNNDSPNIHTKAFLAFKTFNETAYLNKIETLLLSALKDNEEDRMVRKDKDLTALKEALQDFENINEDLDKIQEDEEDMER